MTEHTKRALVTYNHITYFLYIISYFTAGLLWIVPIVMNYVKRNDAKGTWLATHFDWQIKTFWYSILMFIAGIWCIASSVGGIGIGMMADMGDVVQGSGILLVFGLLIMGFSIIWHLYRIIRGWIALADSRPVP